MTFGDLLYALVATASSGLDVEYEWLSGPCVVNSTGIKDTGAGTCRVRAFQDGNDQWNAVSSTRDIEIAKAPHVFTFADRTIPWRPTDRPVQLWATLPSGAPINYNVIDKGEEFPPCRLSGTSLIVDTRTVVAECTLVATQRSTHPDYVDATPKQAKVTIVNPQWVWSFDSTKHSWANDGPNLNVTVSEKAGTTTGLDLFNFSGPCSHLETRANAARTVYTIALNFTGPGTCQFTVMGDPPDFALDPPLGGFTVRATVDQ